ncbi:MAG: hypothetical protein AB7O98_03325 [Hyphomonadaceae bacterium]
MLKHVFGVLALWVVFALPAQAQAFFQSPFLSPAEIIAARGETSPATMRLRYELRRSEGGAPETTSELIIDLAPDWALVTSAEATQLRDFRLNRVFVLQPTQRSFVSQNALGAPFFLIAERQNRAALQRFTAQLGPEAQIFQPCDVDAELGLVVPPNAPIENAELREEGGVHTLRCDNRDAGSFSASETIPLATFWPVLALDMTTHPTLSAGVRQSGRAPQTLSTSFRSMNAMTQRTWRLVSVETISAPYPLDSSFTNTSAAAMDALLTNSGAIAMDAIAGRAAGGAPTLESWNTQVSQLARRDPAAAAMLVLPSFHMFPELEAMCSRNGAHSVCSVARSLAPGVLRDPAPLALIQIAMAEQSNNAAGAIDAMRRAQSSPLRDDPALGASFALALLRFDQEALAQAQAAGLPTDPAMLQARALAALPYNPAYWTDVGDRIGASYDWPSALMFYDVAFSLPMPSAVRDGRALGSKRRASEAVRRDFPQFFLTQ